MPAPAAYSQLTAQQLGTYVERSLPCGPGECEGYAEIRMHAREASTIVVDFLS